MSIAAEQWGQNQTLESRLPRLDYIMVLYPPPPCALDLFPNDTDELDGITICSREGVTFTRGISYS